MPTDSTPMPNYLNIITRKHTGISAKEQINLMLVHVIKTLLDTTDSPVKHISERLHYDDPSYLCRIFRQQTGLTPIQYRKDLASATTNTAEAAEPEIRMNRGDVSAPTALQSVANLIVSEVNFVFIGEILIKIQIFIVKIC